MEFVDYYLNGNGCLKKLLSQLSLTTNYLTARYMTLKNQLQKNSFAII